MSSGDISTVSLKKCKNKGFTGIRNVEKMHETEDEINQIKTIEKYFYRLFNIRGFLTNTIFFGFSSKTTITCSTFVLRIFRHIRNLFCKFFLIFRLLDIDMIGISLL
jgi:hypothetical protein